jgi:methionyl-tRNA formyltransferase
MKIIFFGSTSDSVIVLEKLIGLRVAGCELLLQSLNRRSPLEEIR